MSPPIRGTTPDGKHVEIDLGTPTGIGRAFSWRRAATPVVEEGELRDLSCPDEPGEVYRPFDYPILPTALSQVVDERSARKFARDFGLLGYAPAGEEWKRDGYFSIRITSEERPHEPLAWVLVQARSVRLAMTLIEALQRGDGDASITRVLESRLALAPQEAAALRRRRPREWSRQLASNFLIERRPLTMGDRILGYFHVYELAYGSTGVRREGEFMPRQRARQGGCPSSSQTSSTPTRRGFAGR